MSKHGRVIPGFLLAPALTALAFFVIYLVQLRDQAFVRYLVANPLVYDEQAHRILQGLPRNQPFFLSPLYPAFLALVYAVTGGSRLAFLSVQGALLAINVGLMGTVCAKLVSRGVALAAMFGMTFYWSFYYFAGEILPTTLCLTFLLAGWLLFTEQRTVRLHPDGAAALVFAGLIALVYALPALRHFGSLLEGRSLPLPPGAYWGALSVFLVFALGSSVLVFLARLGGLRHHLNLLACGLIMGFSMLVWSGVSIIAALFALGLLRARERRMVRVGVFVLGLGVSIAAAASHNYLISGDLIPVTSSFGVNLFIGNNPASDGMNPFNLGEGDKVRIEADRQGLAGADRSAFFRKQATSFMRSQPARWLALMGRKALASVSRFHIDNNSDMAERRAAWKWLLLPVLHFGIVFPLGIAGMRYCLRGDGRAYTLVLGFAGCMAVGIIFFVSERFRLPATAFLIPLAACGLFGLLGDALSGRWRSLSLGAVIVLCGTFISNIDFLGLSQREFPSITVNKAHVKRLAGDLDGARELVEAALREEPGNAGAFFQLGAIEEARGNQAGAIGFYLDSLHRDPFFYASYNRAKIILEETRISPSYIDAYVRAVLDGKPHEELRRNLVEYVTTRTSSGNRPKHN